MHKNSEGYPDQTQGDAINGVRREERQRALERKHGYSRGQKIVVEAKSAGRSRQQTHDCKEENHIHSKAAFPVLHSSGGQAWNQNLSKLYQTGSNDTRVGRGLNNSGRKDRWIS